MQRKKPRSMRAGLLLGLLLLTPRPLPAALGVPVAEGRYDTRALTEQDPVLQEIFATANDVGFRVGTWGGASRDYLLGRGPPPEYSDVDMVFDSRELWEALTSEGPVGFVKKMGRLAKGFYRVARVGGVGALRRYTYLDIKEGGRPLTMSVAKLINSGAATINQVGLMSDGSVYDPTGGLADIEAGTLRYRVPKPIAVMVEEFDDNHNPSPYDVLRLIRFKVQYPELEFDEATWVRMREIMALYGPGSEYTKEIASYRQGLGGALRTRLPQALRKPTSAVVHHLFGPQHKHLWPYVETGLKKVLASTTDPAESLRLYRELGVDVFAHEVGLGKYVEELEVRAAATQGPAPEPTPEPAPASLASATLRETLDQAYRNFMAATDAGDMEAARQHYQVFLAARSRLGEAP